ncbi:MAG: hypothetical protein IT210_10125 [Armatimonadetes bacterium]|nr:hypothetical protein [Armatimonadota bacterium]
MRPTKLRYLALLLAGACLWLGACLGGYHVCEMQASGHDADAAYSAAQSLAPPDAPLCVACVWAKSASDLTRNDFLPLARAVSAASPALASIHLSPFLSTCRSRAPPAA